MERERTCRAYERLPDAMGTDAWVVGRVTMAETAKATARPPVVMMPPERPVHLTGGAGIRAVEVDRQGRLHSDRGDIDGDPVVVLLGADVPDGHLAELAGDGTSCVVAGTAEIDLAAALDTLASRFGIRRLLLEGARRDRRIDAGRRAGRRASRAGRAGGDGAQASSRTATRASPPRRRWRSGRRRRWTTASSISPATSGPDDEGS